MEFLNTVASISDKLIGAFTHIVEHLCTDEESKHLAHGLRAKLEDFDFMFSLFNSEELFSQTDVVFDIVQPKSMDVSFCQRCIENLMQVLDEL